MLSRRWTPTPVGARLSPSKERGSRRHRLLLNSNKRKRAEHLDSSDKPTAIAPRPRGQRSAASTAVALVHYFILEEKMRESRAVVGQLIKDGSFMKKKTTTRKSERKRERGQECHSLMKTAFRLERDGDSEEQTARHPSPGRLAPMTSRGAARLTARGGKRARLRPDGVDFAPGARILPVIDAAGIGRRVRGRAIVRWPSNDDESIELLNPD